MSIISYQKVKNWVDNKMEDKFINCLALLNVEVNKTNNKKLKKQFRRHLLSLNIVIDSLNQNLINMYIRGYFHNTNKDNKDRAVNQKKSKTIRDVVDVGSDVTNLITIFGLFIMWFSFCSGFSLNYFLQKT
jgi:CRISPR/Cas system-associated protein endoribonuclease Cas2